MEASDPIEAVRAWIDGAREAGIVGVDTVVVATANPDGTPSARAVLLRGLDERGFAFYTDRRSRKAQELAANPRGALVMFWPVIERQVRAEGPVVLLPDDEADAYFATRPRGHQLASWTSRQSDVLGDRSELEQRLAEVTAEFDGRPVPRPPYWGGYRLVPEAVELWQGRPDRLHDRVRYTRSGDGWRREALWP